MTTSPWFWAMIESHPAIVGAAATRHTSFFFGAANALDFCWVPGVVDTQLVCSINEFETCKIQGGKAGKE